MVQLLRLITGEVIIGEVVPLVASGGYSVSRPAMIHLHPMRDESGRERMGMAMIPYQPWVQGDMHFFESALLGNPSPADDDMTKGYNAQFNPSSIILPPSNDQLLLG